MSLELPQYLLGRIDRKDYFKIYIMEKEFKSTLSDVELLKGRMKGNSERQVNKAIDLLFKGYIVVIHDHFEAGTNRSANEELMNRVIGRIQSNNMHNELLVNGTIKINKKKLTIHLK